MAVMAALLLVGVVMIRTDQIDAQSQTPASVVGESQGSDAVSAPGQEPVAEPVKEVQSTGMFGAVVKMISALAIVIALVYGALYMLRRLMGRRLKGAGGTGSLEVLETTFVGQHKAISLVRVGQRSVLVGVTDNQISTLTELDAEETEEILGAVTDKAGTEGFSGVLTSAVERLKTIGLRKKQAVLES